MQQYLMPLVVLVAEMAPYLLLGFLIAGLLHAFVPRTVYARYLSGNDFRSVVLAALFGVPLPLCSCGVIPTAMSMRREGASRAATVSFLIATPQTGVDSIAATASLLGLPFALLRPLAALVTALGGGALVGAMARNEEKNDATETTEMPLPTSFWGRCVEALNYGFGRMMQDIGKWLVVGLLIAAAITILVPDGFFAQFGDRPLLNMLLVLAISAPMYLCATGSVPIAAALMLKGLSPGAAFVLLMAGPATNMAAILVIGKVLGRKTLVLYLVSIILGAMLFGLGIDYLLPERWFSVASTEYAAACCHGVTLPWWKTASAVLFTALLVVALVRRHKTEKQENQTTITMEKAYKIKGMMCNHCKANVERNLAKLEGVESVRVDLAEGVAYVTGDVEPQKVIDLINDLVYEYLPE